jgi:hypothetical protein
MSHIDPDDLALLALTPSIATEAQRAHLQECRECAREEQDLARTVALGKSADDAELVSPPAIVWSCIHAELGLSDAVADAPVAPAAPATSAALVSAMAPGSVEPSPEPTVSAGDRSRRRVWPLLVAAAVVGVLGGIGGVAWVATLADRVSVIAEAVLDPLPGQEATGNARVEESADGRRDVVVTLDSDDANPAVGESREVWLLTADASGLVSLGFLDGSTGRFVIPDSIDLDRYPVVDVSVELPDGDPTHSGNSVVRGLLQSS